MSLMSIQRETLNLGGSWQSQPSFSIKMEAFARCTISRGRWYFLPFYVTYMRCTLDPLSFSVNQKELNSTLYASVFTFRVGSGLKEEIIITITKKYQKFNTDPRKTKYMQVFLFYPCNLACLCWHDRWECLCIILLLTGTAQEALSGQLVRQTFMLLKKRGCLFCFGE